MDMVIIKKIVYLSIDILSSIPKTFACPNNDEVKATQH